MLRVAAIGHGLTISHHQAVQVLAGLETDRQGAAVSILAVALAGDRTPPDPVGEVEGRLPAARDAHAIASAALRQFRRIDAVKPNADAMDIDGVAVDHPGGPDDHPAGCDGANLLVR